MRPQAASGEAIVLAVSVVTVAAHAMKEKSTSLGSARLGEAASSMTATRTSAGEATSLSAALLRITPPSPKTAPSTPVAAAAFPVRTPYSSIMTTAGSVVTELVAASILPRLTNATGLATAVTAPTSTATSMKSNWPGTLTEIRTATAHRAHGVETRLPVAKLGKLSSTPSLQLVLLTFASTFRAIATRMKMAPQDSQNVTGPMNRA
jgi:hypothetical protein